MRARFPPVLRRTVSILQITQGEYGLLKYVPLLKVAIAEEKKEA